MMLLQNEKTAEARPMLCIYVEEREQRRLTAETAWFASNNIPSPGAGMRGLLLTDTIEDQQRRLVGGILGCTSLSSLVLSWSASRSAVVFLIRTNLQTQISRKRIPWIFTHLVILMQVIDMGRRISDKNKLPGHYPAKHTPFSTSSFHSTLHYSSLKSNPEIYPFLTGHLSSIVCSNAYHLKSLHDYGLFRCLPLLVLSCELPGITSHWRYLRHLSLYP